MFSMYKPRKTNLSQLYDILAFTAAMCTLFESSATLFEDFSRVKDLKSTETL